MIHPDTKLKTVNEQKGRGIFATKAIPKGTITYIKDDLELEIAPDDPRLLNPGLRHKIETYSYIDENGIRVISWDDAKYVNHCCHCNTMSTGYGFEIAIRDIETGDEITDEYGMFNFENTLELSCDKQNCRRKVNGSDLEKYHKEWDSMVKSALEHFEKVEQPLQYLMKKDIRKTLTKYLKTNEGYRSVLSLRSINNQKRI